MKLTILHLFPALLNLSGDRGNIAVLQKRCRLRGMETELIAPALADPIPWDAADIVYLGNGSERDLPLVADRLMQDRSSLLTYRDTEGVLLSCGSSFPLLGHSYFAAKTRYDGLSLLDMTTEPSQQRSIGNIAVNTPFGVVAGFENHSTKTHLASPDNALGTVISGFGNNGEDGTEGAMYKNICGTYLTGPLLPKNPELSDLLIAKALMRKSGAFPELSPLNSETENLAKGYILNYGNRTHQGSHRRI